MARMLLEKSKTMLVYNPGVPATSIAWIDVKLGDEVKALGQLDEAEKLYREALSLHPRNYKATLAMSRLMAAKKDWAQSIAFAEKTLPIADSLDAKALLGDAYLAQGNKEKANEWDQQCELSYKKEVATFDELGKGGPLKVKPIDRQFAQFCADHKMFLDEALVAANRDLQNRPDPHAHKIQTTLMHLIKEQGK